MSVLIVDDSETLRKRLKEALSRIRTDLEFYEASSGEEALRVISSEMHDIVILDISLPDISGIEILKEIKMSDTGTRVIIFTSYPSAEFRERCIAFGADYFFDKCKDYRNILELFRRNFPDNELLIKP
jgi:two-component system cell cycle response regulator